MSASDNGMARLGLYDSVAEQTASLVIRRYSTSFGLASRLLGTGVRQPVENIYALVRVADEIVDGGADEAGLDRLATGRLLNAYELETERALDEGYSADLVVHAFARTARAAGFGTELDEAVLRLDARRPARDGSRPREFRAYVYGSAEVVGLMCLRVFVQGQSYPPHRLETLETGARALGAAFQKVNFLRDLAADHDKLGRSYFPGIEVLHAHRRSKGHVARRHRRRPRARGSDPAAAAPQFAKGRRPRAAAVCRTLAAPAGDPGRRAHPHPRARA